MMQGGSFSKKGSICERRSFLAITNSPTALTPCSWNTFLARTNRANLHVSGPLSDSSDDDHPMALRCHERVSSTSSNAQPDPCPLAGVHSTVVSPPGAPLPLGHSLSHVVESDKEELLAAGGPVTASIVPRTRSAPVEKEFDGRCR